MTQAEARQAAIAAGANPAEVDAFIQREGGARTSAQRISSAFNVPGAVGTNDLTAFHAQKTTAPDASGRGTYLSGANPGGLPSMSALSAATGGGDTGGGLTPAGVPSTPGVAPARVVEPEPNTTSGGDANAALTALSGLTGGAGAVGNQERTGAVGEQSGGLYRALGRRNPPMSQLVLNRKAY